MCIYIYYLNWGTKILRTNPLQTVDKLKCLLFRKNNMQFHFDENVPDTGQEALGYRLTFGKYKNTTLGEIAEQCEGRNYLRYILTTDLASVTASLIRTALDSTLDVLPTLEQAGETRMRFGKHRHRLLKEIVTEKGGMQYLLYISGWDKCSRELRDAIGVISAEYDRQRNLAS